MEKKKKKKPRKKARIQKDNPLSPNTSNDSDDGDSGKELLIRSKKVKKLLQAYRMNNYPTQQETHEEQIIHDRHLDLLRSQLCDLLGEDWEKYL